MVTTKQKSVIDMKNVNRKDPENTTMETKKNGNRGRSN
jgi:hypothetical protein